MKTTALLTILLFFGCSSILDKGSDEDFYRFFERFYSAKSFQLERVAFPLPGQNKQDMDPRDTVYYWEKENWRFLSFYDFDDLVTKCLTVKQEEGFVIELNTREGDPGFVFIRNFERRNGKWFLVYMVEAL